MNILFLRLSSFGDVLHTLPALTAVRRCYPEAQIGWVVEDVHSSLLLGNRDIDHLYLLPRKRFKGGFRSLLAVSKELKPRLRSVRWDIAIDFQGLWKSLLIAKWSGAARILGYKPSVEKTHFFYSDPVQLVTMDRHAVDRNLDLVSSLGIPVHTFQNRVGMERQFPLPLTPGDLAKAEILFQEISSTYPGKSLVFVNFSARKPANRWGTQSFAQLCQRLLECHYQPVLTGGPDDHEEERLIQQDLENPIPSLVGKCTLLELAALMKKGLCIITGDTGPMHLAVAVGLPVIALFGPANPIRTGPYSPSALVIQKPRDCQPCYARHCKYKQEPPPCMTDITVTEVLSKVDEVAHIRARSISQPS